MMLCYRKPVLFAIGHIKAWFHCLLFWNRRIYVERVECNGRYMTTFIGATTGSLRDGTLKVHKTFYGKSKFLHIPVIG